MMKIEFTQCSTDSAEKNRMKQIKDGFNADNDQSVAAIFVLMKRAVNTTSHHEFEERLRQHVGKTIKKDYASP